MSDSFADYQFRLHKRQAARLTFRDETLEFSSNGLKFMTGEILSILNVITSRALICEL